MKKLGEILIEQGSLTDKQLEKALERQKKETGRMLGELLVDMGYVSEEQIVAALANQFKIPYLPLSNFSFNESLSSLIPQELMKKYMCLPIDRIGNLLTVIIADPTNERAVKELEEATRHKIQIFVGTVTDIASALQKHFGVRAAPMKDPDQQVKEISFRAATNPTKKDQKTS